MALHNDKIKLSSGPWNYTIYQRRHLLDYAAKWCKTHFGINGRKKYAISYECYSDPDDTYIGYYDQADNRIYMNLDAELSCLSVYWCPDAELHVAPPAEWHTPRTEGKPLVGPQRIAVF